MGHFSKVKFNVTFYCLLVAQDMMKVIFNRALGYDITQ